MYSISKFRGYLSQIRDGSILFSDGIIPSLMAFFFGKVTKVGYILVTEDLK